MKKHILRVIKIGNSVGVILPRKTYEFKDLKVGDWIECEEVRKIQMKFRTLLLCPLCGSVLYEKETGKYYCPQCGSEKGI